eukprot:TRINITY_DN20492_c0_g1_i1.p1 TRINITY_DN20492_c0_g1~~TRINITY_DN20492_c0_g1_i1.p1  ORF type:complete len:322 (-),score=67.93 TRINITY_DN20492_c0_g1_i1:264-1229(-)
MKNSSSGKKKSEAAAEEAEVEERPKLDDGFYEIEDVRRKRVRKGQIQYLIKWRGWPETANTWEPLENFQSCADIIEAFEERSNNSRSFRKRKRKYQSQAKKKAEESAAPNHNHDDTTNRGVGYEENASKKVEATTTDTSNASTEDEEEDEEDEHHHHNENKDANDGAADPHFAKDKDDDNTSILFPVIRTSEEDSLSKPHLPSPSPSSRFTGAKKRKSGFVRRFKQDKDEAMIDDLESTGDDKNTKLDNSSTPNPPHSIVRIIKPVSYSTSMANNVQDVSVTFAALRSDGKEVVVDNKFLKLCNPLLLIGFYEQHLRYSPV